MREAFWVELSVPRHHVVSSAEVLLEALELLLHQHAIAVGEMMSRLVLEMQHAVSSVLAVNFNIPAFAQVGDAQDTETSIEPEDAVFRESEVAVIESGVVGSGFLEVIFITVHPALELDSIFTGYKCGVLMVILFEIVHLGRVEVTRRHHSLASDDVSSLLRDATLVVTQKVDVVLGSFFLQFLQPALHE